jgi:hypothetical protein
MTIPSLHFRQLNDDRPKAAILCRTAHIHKNPTFRLRWAQQLMLSPKKGSEQCRPSIPNRLDDHGLGDEHIFSLFQIP